MEQPLAIAVHSKAWDSTCKNNAAILPTHAWEMGTKFGVCAEDLQFHVTHKPCCCTSSLWHDNSLKIDNIMD